MAQGRGQAQQHLRTLFTKLLLCIADRDDLGWVTGDDLIFGV